MKKVLYIALCLALALSAMGGAFAEGAALAPGVTVVADENSPTGYTATFVYENADAQSVGLTGTFLFCKPGENYGALPENTYSAFEWEPGMFRASMSDFATTEAMAKVEGTDYWTISLPLPSGHYLYNYNVDGAEGNIPDPANPPMASTAESGNASKLSTLDVPYDARQGDSVDFSFMMPRTDGQSGQIVYADYTDVNGDLAPLAIYLPYGYDAGREEGYKTLYLSHGGGGNEMEWFASGNTNYVFDTLIAEGKVEPTIIVTMCNTTYGWDFDVINENVIGHIIPFMEGNYNVGTEPSDRAFAGLSMGGMTTNNMYAAYADQFGYFGFFSGSDSSITLNAEDVGKLSSPVLMAGNGCYDFFNEDALLVQLKALGIPCDEYIVAGGHDWTVWQVLVRIFATDYLWK